MSEDDTQMILAMAERISELQEENQKLRGTLGTAYNDLEEVMDEKQKLVNHHYQKRLEAEQRLEAVRKFCKNTLRNNRGLPVTLLDDDYLIDSDMLAQKILEVLGGE